MPKFVHESPDAKALFETLGAEKNLLPLLIEKDYWVMHCLWGLQQKGFKFEMKDGTSLSKGWRCIDRFSEDIDIRFEPSEGLNLNGEKRAHIEARFEFYDGLAKEVEIPGIAVQRNRAFDDAKARNGGLSLRFDSYFNPLPELKPEVLLEIGRMNQRISPAGLWRGHFRQMLMLRMRRSLRPCAPLRSATTRLIACSKRSLSL